MTQIESAIFVSGCFLTAAAISAIFELLRRDRIFSCFSMVIVLAGFTTVYLNAAGTNHDAPKIEMANAGNFVSLKTGAQVCENGSTYWTELPQELRGAAYWRYADFQQGRAAFKVEQEGTVYLAATCRWLKDEKGCARDRLLSEGWKYVGPAKSTDLDWQVFKRFCRAGERFNIQTELYQAPVPIVNVASR